MKEQSKSYLTKAFSAVKKVSANKFARTGLIVLALAGGAGVFWGTRTKEASADGRRSSNTAVAEIRNIENSLSSSGTLEPLNTYSITALVSGEVTGAYFEEGDQVEKGQVLYQVATDNLDSKIDSASTSLSRAQKNYAEAQSDYEEASQKYSGLVFRAKGSGYVKEIHASSGDTVNNGTKIIDVYSDDQLTLKLNFLSSDADAIGSGLAAVLTLSATGEQISGTVTNVSTLEQVLTGGRIVKQVTIQVTNPGGLSAGSYAIAEVNGRSSVGEGSFEAILDESWTVNCSGEIAALLVKEGDYVTAGTAIFSWDAKSVEEQLKSYKKSVENAWQSLEDAEKNLSNQEDEYDDYQITAPISGQVVTKNAKEGDTLNNSNSSANTLAVIYDLSALTFQMSVDELDIKNVKVGQTVEVVADAYEAEVYYGTVMNISLVSTYSSGVTNYPVTVQLEETGELLPGMNVTGKIIIAEAEGVLAVPVGALMRGNRVYVKDETAEKTENNGPSVPEGYRVAEVEVGIISSDYVEIISGLSPGDEVYVSEQGTNNTSPQFGMPGGGMPGGGGQMPGGGGGGMPGGGMR